MYVIFRRHVDAEVMAYLLGSVHGFVSYCVRRLRRREPAAAFGFDILAGTRQSNGWATDREDAATATSIPEIIVGDPIPQV
jgi:hypothetical protein